MYFWNVKQLIHDLKTHQVKQSQFKNYYIASSILILVSFFFVAITPEQPVRLNLATFVVNLGLLISWTNAIFKANGGEQGQQFLNRFFALYLPIVLKTLVIFVVAVILIELIWTNYSEEWSESELEKINEYKDVAIDPIFSCVVYWRIYRAMLKIQEPLEN
ncbi:hypothetical protein HYG93_04975 [Acinetobacter sp. SwsAc6]|uniref:hypothetical protein n=1 Tax=Acinetobacter TaxID=469 RepID=UPI000EA184C6|nr:MULTISPECIES: hypothetical protein [Acinetobacter]NWK73649.1 hypothetical protein [Acinetobacter sp. SwsAc6]RKG44964.1 hypothetical protein D7V68_16460 [Acinetobacter cumulans]